MIVRLASEKDMPGLMAIEADCFGSEQFNPEVVRAFVARDDSFTLMAIEDDNIIGSAMCTMPRMSRIGRIASIAVLGRKRRSGVGSRLLVECERILRTKRRRYVTLEVEVSNEPAIALYTRHGYRTTGVIKQYYASDRDAFIMEKRI